MDVDNIDDVVESVNEWEARQQNVSAAYSTAPAQNPEKVLIGRVNEFFDRINVVAISLTSPLNVGDIIEIGTEEEAIRQRISSMQIDKKNVEIANEGESVGIKLKYKVPVGSDVYKITR